MNFSSQTKLELYCDLYKFILDNKNVQTFVYQDKISKIKLKF